MTRKRRRLPLRIRRRIYQRRSDARAEAKQAGSRDYPQARAALDALAEAQRTVVQEARQRGFGAFQAGRWPKHLV
jgi:hypothetical protein